MTGSTHLPPPAENEGSLAALDEPFAEHVAAPLSIPPAGDSFQVPLDATIDAALARLPSRQREILTLRYGLIDGTPRTHDQIGAIFGLTRARIHQIDKRAREEVAKGRFMDRPGSLLATLGAVVRAAGGALSLDAALVAVGAGTQDVVAVARLRFALGFTDTLVLLKEYPVIVVTGLPCPMPVYDLSRLCGALLKALGTSARPLNLDELTGIVAGLPHRIPIGGADCSRLLAALLGSLPEVLLADDGTYRLATARGTDGRDPSATDATHTRRRPYRHQAAPDGSLPGPLPPLDNYDHWNHAIAIDTISGLPRGSTVFLSIDDGSLDRIAALLPGDPIEPTVGFFTSLRGRVTNEARVTLARIQGRNAHGEPNCIVFLAASVLAASRMAESEDREITASAYFARLAAVLDLEGEDGRPRGLRAGAEEPFWREWAVWLGEQGLIASAHAGQGRETYISYPISQALLRDADRDRIRRLFAELRWATDWDADTLVARLRKEAARLGKHLQGLLLERSSRTQAITDAIADVYDEWLERGDAARGPSPRRSRCIYAQVLRHEHPLSGRVTLYLYPRCPRRLSLDRVDLCVAGVSYTLTAERPGWLMPAVPIDEQHLDHGARIPINSPISLEAIVLAQQSFWILVPDPDNPDSGIYASWGKPALGTRFIVLCLSELLPQLQRLRDERLIQWYGDPRPLSPEGAWLEVVDCMVISPAWDGVEIADHELHEKLRPSERFSIGLSGGVRTPNGAGWLEDHGPIVTIFGFPSEADVVITRVADNSTVLDDTRPTNQPFPVNWPCPGDYLVSVASTSQEDTRASLVKIVAWEDLRVAPLDYSLLQWLPLGASKMCGALIVERSEEHSDAPLV